MLHQTSIELGKNKILDVVKEIMKSQNVDLGHVLFRWDLIPYASIKSW